MVLEGLNIYLFQMKTQLSALGLEMKGLRHSSGRSMYAHIKRVYGFRGTRVRVYNQFREFITWLEEGVY